LDSGFYSGDTPLVFIRPVGFTAADSLRLMQAAQRMDEHVRWRLAPAGVQADVYLAHRASVQRGKPLPTQPSNDAARESRHIHSTPEESMSGAYEHSRLHIDGEGRYRGHPVCLLGSLPPRTEADDIYYRLPSLQFPSALQELRMGLTRIETELFGLRALYALGRTAWEERSRWKTHRLHLLDGARLIAAVEPTKWSVYLLSDAPIARIEAGSVMLVPNSSAFAAPGFDSAPLERALWEFAKRCPESMLAQILPSVYLSERLTHRRHNELSERELGDHCVALLSALDTRSRTADELQTGLRLSRPALLRALACLALTRSIRPERQTSRMRRWLGWLPTRLRQRMFGPSALV
jgi:hypothetical protein